MDQVEKAKRLYLARSGARQQADLVVNILSGYIPVECRLDAVSHLAEVFSIHGAKITTVDDEYFGSLVSDPVHSP